MTTRDWTWLPEIERDYHRLREHDATCENDISWWRRDVLCFPRAQKSKSVLLREIKSCSCSERENQVLLLSCAFSESCSCSPNQSCSEKSVKTEISLAQCLSWAASHLSGSL